MVKKSPSSQQSTRDKLIDAAFDIFGQYGYEGATTRMIAKKAGVNIASIPYYFRGKEGLYTTIIQEVAHQLHSRILQAEAEIAATNFSSEDGPERAQNFIIQILDNHVTFMLGSKQAIRFARIMLREQLYPSAAFTTIFDDFIKPLGTILTRLLLVRCPHLQPREASLLCATLIGQVIVFRIARETMIHMLGMQGYSLEDVKEIRTMILQNCRDLLTAKALHAESMKEKQQIPTEESQGALK